MKFLYPNSQQFPFDNVCTEIVRALKVRSWQVPGLEVEFCEIGSGDLKYCFLKCLRGADFKLQFSGEDIITNNPLVLIGDLRVSSIVISGKEIRVRKFESDSALEDMDKFKQYLELTVLPMILAQPIAEVGEDIFMTKMIPFLGSIGRIFTFGTEKDATRIRMGQEDSNQLCPGDRYGLSKGEQLVSPFILDSDRVPKAAFKNFIWCGVSEVDEHTPIEALEIPDYLHNYDYAKYVILVRPNRANDIYVVEHDVYAQAWLKIKAESGHGYLSYGELSGLVCARAQTIVTINEYKSNFKQPIILVGRELGLDEVELLSGPWES